MRIFLFIAICIAINIQSPKEVQQVLLKMAQNLLNFYDRNNIDGHLENGSKTQDGFQWYEGGIFWLILMEYTRLTGDDQFAKVITTVLAKSSYGTKGSFLGNIPTIAALSGKWNDDS